MKSAHFLAALLLISQIDASLLKGPPGPWISGREFTEILLDAKTAKGITWEDIAEVLDVSSIFLCSVCLGQNLLETREQGLKLLDLLQLNAGFLPYLITYSPTKAQLNWSILKQDPVLYRLHEINLVYGTSIKELIHEKFGDGVMSSTDLEITVDKASDTKDPKANRVVITLNGKFDQFKKW